VRSTQAVAESDVATSTQARSDTSATTVLPRSVSCAFPLCFAATVTTPWPKCWSEESLESMERELLSLATASIAEPRLSLRSQVRI
jgi:hypothetical protein